MLVIDDLHASVGPRHILRGVTLSVEDGQLHAVMGPNGAGKSTLARILAGADGYDLAGQVLFDGVDLLGLSPEQRASAGVFLAFQQPVEIPGVGNLQFLRAALNALRRSRGLDEMSTTEFIALAERRMRLVGMDRDFMSRPVNEGFSGGEKKRNEILQMAVLEPRLAILDETDSGLDIDALAVVASGIEALRSPERSTLVITHHRQLLDHVAPDRVHVMVDGRIVRTGGPELAAELESGGYGAVGAALQGHDPAAVAG